MWGSCSVQSAQGKGVDNRGAEGLKPPLRFLTNIKHDCYYNAMLYVRNRRNIERKAGSARASLINQLLLRVALSHDAFWSHEVS